VGIQGADASSEKETGRVEASSDGVFAIAITLAVFFGLPPQRGASREEGDDP
jgi:uncharacterized membrane protein